MLHLVHTDPEACDVIISSLIALQVRMIERCADSLLYQGLANMPGATRKRIKAILKRSKKPGLSRTAVFEGCVADPQHRPKGLGL